MSLIRSLTLFSIFCWLFHSTFCSEERDLVVITVATNETDGYHRYMRSLNVYGLNVKVLGLGLPWEGGDVKNYAGGGQKVLMLREELAKYKDEPNTVIMFTDSYDVIFTAGKSVILEKFDNLDARVVFGAEDFCWPNQNLATQYPRVSFGYKYLNSGGFIGYASEVHKIVSSQDISNLDDDQLYYTQIFLDKNLREKYKIKLDTQANIFQNLNGQLGDVSLKFEDHDVKIINTVYQSTPVVIHGNGLSKIQLNSLGNYLAKSWTHDDGCLSCRENSRDLKKLPREEYPRVLIAVFVAKPMPFLEEMLAKVASLNYPKDKLDLLVYNLAEMHEDLVNTWVAEQNSAGYRSTKVISADDNMKEWHARNLALELCLKNSCDALFSVDGDVHLDNADTLALLLEHNRPILGAAVIREGQAWSTFWGAINEDGFYARSIDYMDIVHNSRR
ncbi:procollagen-lysine,2-oxoglutarate 5-dioxygenase 1 [Cherax quadricarinatus]|nr:procollagen-lysine,2-oxoglutarate 5-dioxygenase 1-like [Cherax quadricarinatus]